MRDTLPVDRCPWPEDIAEPQPHQMVKGQRPICNFCACRAGIGIGPDTDADCCGWKIGTYCAEGKLPTHRRTASPIADCTDHHPDAPFKGFKKVEVPRNPADADVCPGQTPTCCVAFDSADNVKDAQFRQIFNTVGSAVQQVATSISFASDDGKPYTQTEVQSPFDGTTMGLNIAHGDYRTMAAECVAIAGIVQRTDFAQLAADMNQDTTTDDEHGFSQLKALAANVSRVCQNFVSSFPASTYSPPSPCNPKALLLVGPLLSAFIVAPIVIPLLSATGVSSAEPSPDPEP